MLRGMITEQDFEECECAFPGIARYYADLKDKPSTFLELVWAYLHRECTCVEAIPVASRPAITVPIR
jgi:hypothetical protein